MKLSLLRTRFKNGPLLGLKWFCERKWRKLAKVMSNDKIVWTDDCVLYGKNLPSCNTYLGASRQSKRLSRRQPLPPNRRWAKARARSLSKAVEWLVSERNRVMNEIKEFLSIFTHISIYTWIELADDEVCKIPAPFRQDRWGKTIISLARNLPRLLVFLVSKWLVSLMLLIITILVHNPC